MIYRYLPCPNDRTHFLSWHSENPLELDDIEKRLDLIEQFSPTHGTCRHVFIGAQKHIGLVVWEPNIEGMPKLCGTVNGHFVGATYPPFGISRIINVRGSIKAGELQQLATALVNNPGRISELSPPTLIASATLSHGIHLFNDVRGAIDCYSMNTSREGITSWTSSPYLSLIFALEYPVEDIGGAAQRAFWGYYPDTLTPFKNAPRVMGGTHIHVEDSPKPPSISCRDYIGRILSTATADHKENVKATEIAEEYLDSLNCTIMEGRGFYNTQWSMGLSGGRDSRLLLSGLIELNEYKDILLYTIPSMTSDMQIGEQIFRTASDAGYDLNWERRDSKQFLPTNQGWTIFDSLPPSSNGLVFGKNQLLDRLVYAVHLKNGNTMPGQYFAAPQRGVTESLHEVSLQGTAGETLRAYRYSEKDVLVGLEPFLKRFEKRFRKSGASSMFSQFALDTSYKCWRSYLANADDIGIGGFHKFDFFSITAQQSRRLELGRNFIDIAPLSCPVLLSRAFPMSAIEKTHNSYHIKIINRLCPWLKRVEYSFQIPVPMHEIRRDSTHMPAFFSNHSIPGFWDILDNTDIWQSVFDYRFVKSVFRKSRYNIFRYEVDDTINDYQKDRLACNLAWRVAQNRYTKLLRSFIDTARKSF